MHYTYIHNQNQTIRVDMEYIVLKLISPFNILQFRNQKINSLCLWSIKTNRNYIRNR